MNDLDITTLLVTGGLTTIVCTVYFLLETLLRRNDAAGRLWSVFYVGSIFTVFSYVISQTARDAWWTMVPANGAFVVAVGILWCGARVANRRGSLLLLPFLAGVAVAIATLIPGREGGYWAGSVEMFVAIAVLAGLGALEFSRGSLGSMLSARILSVMLAVVSLFFAGRAGALTLLGPDDATFTTFFGTAAATIFELCLVVVGTITLSSVQAERFDRPGRGERDARGIHLDGVLGARAFRELAESWLLRSLRERATLVLLVLEIADLDDINVAFGRAAGDTAVRVTARAAVTHAPTAVLIGRITPRRFALLMPLPANDSVEAIADRIGEALLNTAIDDHDRFRVTTFRGITSTRTAGSRYDDLVRAAADAVALDAAAARSRAEQAAGVLSGN